MSDAAVIVLYGVTLAPFALCALVYGWRSPWWRWPVGRVLMGLLSSMCAALSLGLAVRVFGYDGAVVDVLRTVSLIAVSIFGWLLLHQIIRLQRDRPDPRAPRRRATDLQGD